MHDANSTFNETYMQVTGLHITVLAASKHIGLVMVQWRQREFRVEGDEAPKGMGCVALGTPPPHRGRIESGRGQIFCFVL